MANREKFTNVDPAFESAEAFGGGHIEYEVLKHLQLLSEVFLYPSLTESGRLRSYFKADVGYSFAKHFTVGVNYTLNTDNKPAVNSTNIDYIFNFKFGWSLN